MMVPISKRRRRRKSLPPIIMTLNMNSQKTKLIPETALPLSRSYVATWRAPKLEAIHSKERMMATVAKTSRNIERSAAKRSPRERYARNMSQMTKKKDEWMNGVTPINTHRSEGRFIARKPNRKTAMATPCRR